MKELKTNDARIDLINDFIKKDTANYTKFEKSICGKIYNLEERVIERDKKYISSLEIELEQSRINYENTLKEIENMEPSGSFFDKISFSSKKKKLIAKAEKHFEDTQTILQNRLKNAKLVYEQDRIKLQELINKVEASGVKWYELKRILQEKLMQGFFIHKSLISKKKKDTNLFFSKSKRRERQLNETKNGEGGRTFKEKNYGTREELYKIKGLNTLEKLEYDDILSHILFKDGECLNPEIAWKMRLSLLDRGDGKYKHLALYSSSKAIYDNLFMYFVRDGGLQYQTDYEKIFSGAGAITTKIQFFKDKAEKILTDSGFDSKFIDENSQLYEKEVEDLFSSPSDMKFVLDRLTSSSVDDYNMNLKFENEIKAEINNRLEFKVKQNTSDSISQDMSQLGLGRR